MKTEVQMLNKNNELFSVFSEPHSQEVQLKKISISLLPWPCKPLSLYYGCAACLTQQSSRGFHQASTPPQQHRSLLLSGLSAGAHASGATAGPPQGPPCSMQEPPQKFLRCKARPFVCRAPSCGIHRAAMSHSLHAGTKAAINLH